MPQKHTPQELAKAIHDSDDDHWVAEDWRVVLPSSRLEVNGVKVGEYLYHATRREKDGRPKFYLPREVARALVEKSKEFSQHLTLHSTQDKYYLSKETPTKALGEKSIYDVSRRPEFAQAIGNSDDTYWVTEDWRVVLPPSNFVASCINVGEYLHKATQRHENGRPKFCLPSDAARALVGKSKEFDQYLTRHSTQDKYILSEETPTLKPGEKLVSDTIKQLSRYAQVPANQASVYLNSQWHQGGTQSGYASATHPPQPSHRHYSSHMQGPGPRHN